MLEKGTSTLCIYCGKIVWLRCIPRELHLREKRQAKDNRAANTKKQAAFLN